jgi:hypothetical protein
MAVVESFGKVSKSSVLIKNNGASISIMLKSTNDDIILNLTDLETERLKSLLKIQPSTNNSKKHAN